MKHKKKSISTGCLRVNPPRTNLPQWKFHMCTETDLTSLRLHLETFSQRWMWWKAGWWTHTGIVRSQPGWKRKTVFPQRVFVGVWPPTLSRAALTPVYNNLVTVTRYCTVCVQRDLHTSYVSRDSFVSFASAAPPLVFYELRYGTEAGSVQWPNACTCVCMRVCMCVYETQLVPVVAKWRGGVKG